MAEKKKSTAKRSAPIRSTTKEAKRIIRNEIKNYIKPKEYGARSTLDAMKQDADAYDGGYISRYQKSDYIKGAALVDAGKFACYYNDQRVMLRKIYGDKVDNWDGDKVHNTYKHLIGREYSAMLDEREKARVQRTSPYTITIRAASPSSAKKGSKGKRSKK